MRTTDGQSNYGTFDTITPIDTFIAALARNESFLSCIILPGAQQEFISVLKRKFAALSHPIRALPRDELESLISTFECKPAPVERIAEDLVERYTEKKATTSAAEYLSETLRGWR